MATEIFIRPADNNELSDWWDEVEANREFEPFCYICDRIISARAESVEIFFKTDFDPGETIEMRADCGLAAHKHCTESPDYVIVPEW